MSSIWVLEKWVSLEETENRLEEIKNMLSDVYEKLDENVKKSYDNVIASLEQRIIESRVTGGYWLGYQGKSDYKLFCSESIKTIKQFNKLHAEKLYVSNKFRVFKAQLIDESSSYWLNNYTACEEKIGIANYLMVGARK